METSAPNNFPALRGDLRFILQEGSDQSYILEDPLAQKFYRVGGAEYLFLTQLDGQSTLDQIVVRTNALLSDTIFQEQEAEVIFSWLIHNQLLATTSEAVSVERTLNSGRAKQKRLLNRLNLITIKLPLLNPDPFFTKISPWMGWFTGPYFAVTWLFVCCYALMVFLNHSGEFFQEAATTLDSGNLIFLWLAWFLLKVVHELAHGLTCYRYHGRVFEAGLLFVVFFPLTYINGSSSLRFPTRWQRIHAAGAGIYVELFIAAIALLIWVENPNSVTSTLAHNVVLVAGFSSLLFNANPLMRFDGYFILSDLLGIPNLYSRGKEFVGSMVDYIFWGTWSYIRRLSVLQETFVALYGAAAWAWRMMILAFLLLLVSSMFHGFGIIIAIISLVLLAVVPGWQFAKKVYCLTLQGRAHLYRFGLGLASVLVFLGLTLFAIRFEPSLSVPAVVQYENEALAKTKVAGMVEEVFASSGEYVEVDTPLLKLSNPELRLELKQLQAKHMLLLVKKRNSLLQEAMSQYQVLERQVKVIDDRLKALELDVASLIVRAPVSGTVLARNIGQRVGTYLLKGTEVAWIVDEGAKKLLAAVRQDEISGFRGQRGSALIVTKQSMDRFSFTSKVKIISPKASKYIPHHALSAAAGGPIAVRYRQSYNGVSGGAERSERDQYSRSSPMRYEFFNPRFEVEIDIPPDVADLFFVGQVVTVVAGGDPLTPWTVMKNFLSRYFLGKLSADET